VSRSAVALGDGGVRLASSAAGESEADQCGQADVRHASPQAATGPGPERHGQPV